MKLTAAVLGLACFATGCDSNSQTVLSGEELYANNCASCHGALGEGDGPVADVLRVSMPNLRGLSLRNSGAFPANGVRAYIDGRELPAAHGDRYMPIWGNIFGWGQDIGKESELGEENIVRRIDALVEHLRTLQYR